jgi:hypothetical protein
MLNEYENTSFYQIVCKDESITECYVGHTINFQQRIRQHSSICSNVDSDKHHLKVYDFIRSNGGWNNWNMIEIETCNCENVYEARAIERCWIESLGGELNCIIPNRDKPEYYQEHIEHITEYKHNWYEKNKERIAIKSKQYYIDNKERRSEIMKKYYESNKEHLKQQSKEHYELNKEHCLEQQKKYNKAHKEQVAQRKKEYAIANKEKLAKYKKEWYERKKLQKQQEQKGK